MRQAGQPGSAASWSTRIRCGSRPKAGSRSCRASTRAPGGCRTPPRRCRPVSSAMSGASGSLTSAPLRAVKRPTLASRGAVVTAVDQSGVRLQRLRENLARLSADGRSRRGRRRDVAAGRAVRRGAARRAVHGDRHDPPSPRHPAAEAHRRRRQDWPSCSSRCSKTPFAWSGPAGIVVFCTCSLEPEEGAKQVNRLLKANRPSSGGRSWRSRLGGEPDWITREGDLRTMPYHLLRAKPELVRHGRLLRCPAGAQGLMHSSMPRPPCYRPRGR